MKLKKIAHSRTGDKGDTAIISLIAYDPGDYPLLKEKVTAEVVASYFAIFCVTVRLAACTTIRTVSYAAARATLL